MSNQPGHPDTLTALRRAVLCLWIPAMAAAQPPTPATVPGVVINHSPQASGLYIGSPHRVATPKGQIVNILRVDVPRCPERAAIMNISPDGEKARFDPVTGFIGFPGGAKKFTIRFDPKSNLYWSIATVILEPYQKAGRPAGIRNTLALTCSPNLRDWAVRCVLLHHPDVAKCGFQYVDWLFDGDDLVAACRTAFDDGQGGAHNNHDANYLTFHRIANFRGAKTADQAFLSTTRSKSD